MAEIRSTGSGLPAPGGTPARAPNPGRAAAQRAFFDAALGAAQTGAAPQPTALRPAATQPAAVAVQTTQAAPSKTAAPDAPQRYLRPGSLIDIKV